MRNDWEHEYEDDDHIDGTVSWYEWVVLSVIAVLALSVEAAVASLVMSRFGIEPYALLQPIVRWLS